MSTSISKIYEWGGTINGMGQIETDETETLSQSFRFGPEIAASANRILRALGENVPLRGNSDIRSSIGPDGEADAILARTNATVIAETLAAIDRGRRPYIVGGTTDLRRLVGDVFNLMKGEPATHPDFFGFKNWEEVVAYADTDEGESLKPNRHLGADQYRGPALGGDCSVGVGRGSIRSFRLYRTQGQRCGMESRSIGQ
jgi:hypothetical protein